MEILKKIVNNEININSLPEEEVKRLIVLCEAQKENMERRINEKEETITRLESEIEKYKKV